MISSLSMEEESFCEGFGDILIARYADNCLYDPQESLTDEAAVVFARYLRAARSNANLSQAELAAQAGIPEAEVVALEHGIILSTKIKEESLLALAKALDEDIESFTLVLGWGIPRPGRSGIPAKLCRAWNAGVAFMGSTRNLLLVLTLMMATVTASLALVLQTCHLCLPNPSAVHASIESLASLAANTARSVLLVLVSLVGLLNPSGPDAILALTEPIILLANNVVRDGQIVQLELLLLFILILLLIWVAIWKGHLPLKKAADRYGWSRRLVYATPMALLFGIVMMIVAEEYSLGDIHINALLIDQTDLVAGLTENSPDVFLGQLSVYRYDDSGTPVCDNAEKDAVRHESSTCYDVFRWAIGGTSDTRTAQLADSGSDATLTSNTIRGNGFTNIAPHDSSRGREIYVRWCENCGDATQIWDTINKISGKYVGSNITNIDSANPGSVLTCTVICTNSGDRPDIIGLDRASQVLPVALLGDTYLTGIERLSLPLGMGMTATPLISVTVRITNTPVYESHSDWSPDGTVLTLFDDTDSNLQIYIMDIDGDDDLDVDDSDNLDVATGRSYWWQTADDGGDFDILYSMYAAASTPTPVSTNMPQPTATPTPFPTTPTPTRTPTRTATTPEIVLVDVHHQSGWHYHMMMGHNKANHSQSYGLTCIPINDAASASAPIADVLDWIVDPSILQAERRGAILANTAQPSLYYMLLAVNQPNLILVLFITIVRVILRNGRIILAFNKTPAL